MSTQTMDMRSAAQLDLEHELRAGRDVMLELERRTSNKSGVSALSEGNEHGGELDLLAETERLLAKMNELNSLNYDGANASASYGNLEGIGMKLSEDAEDDAALNEILAKAEQLSSLMQSMQSSENFSLHNGDGHASDFKALSNPPAGFVTPTTADENSSRRSLKQDPPGSVADEHDNNKIQTPSPASSQALQRPTSAVHLPLTMMDDEVSSVGSASFRPYPRTESKNSRQFSPNLHEIVDTPQRPDSLLGVLPKMEQTTNADSPDDSEDVPSEPVCSKIPATDLRADFEVMEASSRRDASEGAVQWEKVTTARPGEDDYVPLVDYSHMRPSAGNSSKTVESRLERHRRRTQARRKRRIRIAVAVLPVVVAVALYYFYGRETVSVEQDVVPVEEKEIEPLYQSYDTTLLQDAAAEGFSFEGEDPSILVTLPKLILPSTREEEVQEKPKRRGLFGRMKKA